MFACHFVGGVACDVEHGLHKSLCLFHSVLGLLPVHVHWWRHEVDAACACFLMDHEVLSFLACSSDRFVLIGLLSCLFFVDVFSAHVSMHLFECSHVALLAHLPWILLLMSLS